MAALSTRVESLVLILYRSGTHVTVLCTTYMGGRLSDLQQTFPPRPTWGVNEIPDLTGKVILVTGACTKCHCACFCSTSVGGNCGIGKETVKVSYRCLPRDLPQCLPRESQ